MKRILLFVALLLSFLLNTKAQQVPLYSQYMMNGFLLNPAVAGSEGYTAVNLTVREQWLGLKDAPKTQAISGQTRILKNSYISKSASIRKRQRLSSRSGNIGLGGYIFNDQNGPISRTGMQLCYAYHIRFNRSQLSFGLSGIAYQFAIDDSKINLEDPSDQIYMNAAKSIFIPDASAGVYYSDPKTYAGFSATQLFQSALKLGEKGYAEYKMKRYYYLTAGYDFNVNDNFTIEPSFLLKASENKTYQVDINSKFIFNEEYWAGISYRTGGALIFMGGVRVDKFFFGYAFDYTLSSIMKRTYGSHEIMIAIKFGDNARRYRWLNRY
ncbi:MAG TPA: type IX secretion system membrane protein PorP/SprF [Bacteroidales bacterium]|nr:type IX secretion system membrane protein PorP/SprF [Bacteroidales bacterium]